MRILHLVSYSLYSGPVPPTLGLALAQREAGHSVWLAHDMRRGNFDGFEEAADPRVAPHGMAPPEPLLLCNRAGPWWQARDAYRLRRLCRQVDVLHCHMSHDHLLASLVAPAGTTVVRTVHAPRCLERRFGQRFLWAHSAGAIVRSGVDHRRLLAQWPQPPQRLALIPSGIDAARFSGPAARTTRAAAAAAWRQRLGIPPAGQLVGQVALLAQRGQGELIAAVALRQQAAAAGLADRVHFVGYVPQAELPGLYAALDLAFVGRLGNDAGGRAVLEPLAAGIPLVAYGEAGAVQEACTQDRALLVDSLRPAGLAAALRAVLEDGPQGAARALRAQTFVLRQRTFAQEAAATLRFYTIVRALPGTGARPDRPRASAATPAPAAV
jgi:glycosyltransferase involved in cell wall biosynthesis